MSAAALSGYGIVICGEKPVSSGEVDAPQCCLEVETGEGQVWCLRAGDILAPQARCRVAETQGRGKKGGNGLCLWDILVGLWEVDEVAPRGEDLDVGTVSGRNVEDRRDLAVGSRCCAQHATEHASPLAIRDDVDARGD